MDGKPENNIANGEFENPHVKYRGFPFWAWNSELKKDELEEQIEIFKSMGFGGFFMHVRQGLETRYLGNDFMDAVGVCAKKSERTRNVRVFVRRGQMAVGRSRRICNREQDVQAEIS